MQESVLRAGGVEIHLDDDGRIATFTWDHPDSMSGDTADALIPQMDSWVSSFPGRFGFLIDGRTSHGTAPGGQAWMERWAAFHERHSPRGRVAVYLPTLFMRGRLIGYQQPAKTPLQIFSSESSAREWLDAEIYGK